MDVQLFKTPKQRWTDEADDIIEVADEAEFTETVKQVAQEHLPAVTAAIFDPEDDVWHWTPRRDAPETFESCQAVILGCPPYEELYKHAVRAIESGQFMTSSERADELIEQWEHVVTTINDDIQDPDMIRGLYETLSELITYNVEAMDDATQDEYDELEHLVALIDLFMIDIEGQLSHDRRDDQLL